MAVLRVRQQAHWEREGIWWMRINGDKRHRNDAGYDLETHQDPEICRIYWQPLGSTNGTEPSVDDFSRRQGEMKGWFRQFAADRMFKIGLDGGSDE